MRHEVAVEIEKTLKWHGFETPLGLLRLLQLGVRNFNPWWILSEKAEVSSNHAAIAKLYRQRKLLPFARRLDIDDVACFDLTGQGTSGPRILVIHEGAHAGNEVQAEYDSFDSWFHQAVGDFYALVTLPRATGEPQ